MSFSALVKRFMDVDPDPEEVEVSETAELGLTQQELDDHEMSFSALVKRFMDVNPGEVEVSETVPPSTSKPTAPPPTFGTVSTPTLTKVVTTGDLDSTQKVSATLVSCKRKHSGKEDIIETQKRKIDRDLDSTQKVSATLVSSKRKNSGKEVIIETQKRKMDGNELDGPSLLSDLPASPIELSSAEFNSFWDFMASDRLNLATCDEYSSSVVPPLEKKALRALDTTNMETRLNLGLSQTMVLGSELTLRSKQNRELNQTLIEKLNSAEKEAKTAGKNKRRMEAELLKCKKDLEKLQQKNDGLELKFSDLKTRYQGSVRECKAWESKCIFYKGEGASQLVRSLLGSSEFFIYLADLCAPISRMGATSALKKVKELHPSIDVVKIKGYDANSESKMDTLINKLREGRVNLPVQQYLPPSPPTEFYLEEESQTHSPLRDKETGLEA